MVLMYARRCWMTLTPIRSPGTVVVLATLCACGHSSATSNSGGATDAGAAGGEAVGLNRRRNRKRRGWQRSLGDDHRRHRAARLADDGAGGPAL